MNKEYYKEQYKNYNIEYLIQLKSLGSELSESAHLAIEEILKEDGYKNQKIPTKDDEPIVIKTEKNIKHTLWTILWAIMWLIFGTVSLAVSKIMANTTPSYIAIAVYLIYLIYSWWNKRKKRN